MYESQLVLKKEVLKLLNLRRSSDPSFNKRKLAEELGIHRVTFYQFLSGKRVLKRKTALRYFKNKMSEDRWAKVEHAFSLDENFQTNYGKVNLFEKDEDNPRQTEDQYFVGSDPLSWALLHLLEVKDYKKSFQWKADRLGISVDDVKQRIERLLRLGLIQESERGFSRTEKVIVTTDRRKNESVLEHRKKLFPIMEKALHLDPVKERDFYHSIFAIDPKDLPEFQKLIRRFSKAFDKKQLASKPKRVYCFFQSLFPMSK